MHSCLPGAALHPTQIPPTPITTRQDPCVRGGFCLITENKQIRLGGEGRSPRHAAPSGWMMPRPHPSAAKGTHGLTTVARAYTWDPAWPMGFPTHAPGAPVGAGKLLVASLGERAFPGLGLEQRKNKPALASALQLPATFLAAETRHRLRGSSSQTQEGGLCARETPEAGPSQ